MEKVLTFYYTREKKFKIRSKTILRYLHVEQVEWLSYVFFRHVSGVNAVFELWTLGKLEYAGFGFLDETKSSGLLIKSKMKSSLPNVQDILIPLSERTIGHDITSFNSFYYILH